MIHTETQDDRQVVIIIKHTKTKFYGNEKPRVIPEKSVRFSGKNKIVRPNRMTKRDQERDKAKREKEEKMKNEYTTKSAYFQQQIKDAEVKRDTQKTDAQKKYDNDMEVIRKRFEKANHDADTQYEKTSRTSITMLNMINSKYNIVHKKAQSVATMDPTDKDETESVEEEMPTNEEEEICRRRIAQEDAAEQFDIDCNTNTKINRNHIAHISRVQKQLDDILDVIKRERTWDIPAILDENDWFGQIEQDTIYLKTLVNQTTYVNKFIQQILTENAEIITQIQEYIKTYGDT